MAEAKKEEVKTEETKQNGMGLGQFVLETLGFILILMGVNYLIFQERILGKKAAEIENYVNQAYILPDDNRTRNLYDRNIVMLYSMHVKPHPHHSLREEEFDLNFGNQLRVRRITQYCQWNEVKKNDGTVSYEKGWVDHLISSDDFVDEKHHVNIDRDPFPSRVSVPRRILIGSYVVDPPFFNHTHTYTNRYEATSFSTQYVPARTKKHGFLYVSKNWYYSSIRDVGRTDKLGRENMTILTEEEEEKWDADCMVGDIRVGFETERMPFEVTVYGIQNDYRIMPIRKDGKAHYILFESKVYPKNVLSYIEKKEGLNIQNWRYLCAVAVFLGMLCRISDAWPFEYLPIVLRALACAVLYPMFTSLGCRIVLYGVRDTNVYKMMLYLILPLLLFISLNVLFRLIKMYRFGLRVLQAQKEKEKEQEGTKEKQDWTVCCETFL